MDGINLPKFDRKLFRRKKKPPIAYGDMIDYVDEDIITFEELTDDEKDKTLFIANLITAALFFITSLFV